MALVRSRDGVHFCSFVKGGRGRCLTETSEKICFIDLSHLEKGLSRHFKRKTLFLSHKYNSVLHYNTFWTGLLLWKRIFYYVRIIISWYSSPVQPSSVFVRYYYSLIRFWHCITEVVSWHLNAGERLLQTWERDNTKGTHFKNTLF